MEPLKGAGAGASKFSFFSANDPTETPAHYLKGLEEAYKMGGISQTSRDALLVVYKKAFKLHKQTPTKPLSLAILEVKSKMMGQNFSEAHLRGKLEYYGKVFNKKVDALPNRDDKSLREICDATAKRVLAKEPNTCAGPGCTVTDMECRHANSEKRGLQLCGRCKAISYCSVACQTKHWKAGHKAECQEA